MQRFVLIHNGSNQAWQTAYLAFHVSASLGARLMVLIIDPIDSNNPLSYSAKQIEIAGRTAGVVIETLKVNSSITDILVEYTREIDGIFIPRIFIPDAEVLNHYLDIVSCPIWIVTQNAEHNKMAILIENLSKEISFIDYAITLASRLQHSLTGLIQNSEPGFSHLSDFDINWYSLTDFSNKEISMALKRLEANLLFFSKKNASIIENLSINFVVFPNPKDA